ncbi:TPA: hypothetical protein ACH27V_001513, partial [Klebsiella quasipneumoniae subsp. similipneumoniae]
EQDDKGWDARKRAYCLKIQPATGSFARNLIYSTKPFRKVIFCDSGLAPFIRANPSCAFQLIPNGPQEVSAKAGAERKREKIQAVMIFFMSIAPHPNLLS